MSNFKLTQPVKDWVKAKGIHFSLTSFLLESNLTKTNWKTN